MKYKKEIITCLSIIVIAFIVAVIINNNQTNNTSSNKSTNILTSDPNVTKTPILNEPKLKIVDGWKNRIGGNYVYIEGSVQNVGDVPITYFKITAKYLDINGNVLDSDYTNSAETLSPNEQKKFQIMTKYDSRFEKISLHIDEVD